MTTEKAGQSAPDGSTGAEHSAGPEGSPYMESRPGAERGFCAKRGMGTEGSPYTEGRLGEKRSYGTESRQDSERGSKKQKRSRADAFSSCHPAVNFVYFLVVLLTTVLMTHPVLLGISFAGALCYAGRLRGWRPVLKFNILYSIPAMILVALINPLFNHYGVTFLFYLKTGPVTVEAIVYGVVLSSMLFISILWFSCCNVVMTTDKFVYLFGRVIPALSLVLSMVFRFVPRFHAQAKIIRNGQKAVGRDAGSGNLIQRIRHSITILSVLITWALENAIDTSDSMQSRGYGLRGRTAFSIFRFDARDGMACGVLGASMAVFLLGASQGVTTAVYNPYISIGGWPLTPAGVLCFAAWAVICFFPSVLGAVEDARFASLARKARLERHLPWYLQDTVQHGKESSAPTAG